MSNSEIENDPLSELMGYQLRRLTLSMMANLNRRLAAVGLSPTEASVLLLVRANPGLTQSEIGRHLAIKRANMVPIIAKLEGMDCIVRKTLDGRSFGLICTAHGESTAHESVEAMKACDDEMVAMMPPEQQSVAHDIIFRMRQAAETSQEANGK